MKVNDEIRKAIIAACRGEVDSWTNGNAPEIILDAMDALSDETKLELCLRYLPGNHLLFKSYQMTDNVNLWNIEPKAKPKPRDYTTAMEPRGV